MTAAGETSRVDSPFLQNGLFFNLYEMEFSTIRLNIV